MENALALNFENEYTELSINALHFNCFWVSVKLYIETWPKFV